MKTEQKIPFGISEYITDHFKEDFLFEVKDVKNIRGHFIYTIEVSKDDYIHTLKFNEDGSLLKEEAQEAFPPDSHEEPIAGDVPE
jgi:hypothetical protein